MMNETAEDMSGQKPRDWPRDRLGGWPARALAVLAAAATLALLGLEISTTAESSRDAAALRPWLLAALALAQFALWLPILARLVRGERPQTEQTEEREEDPELSEIGDSFDRMTSDLKAFCDNLQNLNASLMNTVEQRTLALRDRNRAMRRLLDNVDQGLVTLDMKGVIQDERSASLDRWFGPPQEGETFGTYLQRIDEECGSWFEVTWSVLEKGFVPQDVALTQLPRALRSEKASYTIEYKPIERAGEFVNILVIVSDITAAEEAQRAEQAEREVLTIFQHLQNDRVGFLDFFRDTDSRIASLGSGGGLNASAHRDLHTIKGNTSAYALHSVASVCQEIEKRMNELNVELTTRDAHSVQKAWKWLRRTLKNLIESDHKLPLSSAVIEQVPSLFPEIAAEQRPAPLVEIAGLPEEPVAPRMQRWAEQLGELADRLGKPLPQVQLSHHDLSLPRARWAPLWPVMIHLLRNAVDHGLETPREREDHGKQAEPQISLRCWQEDNDDRLEIEDDGRGIDWQRIGEKASHLGLPHATHEDLITALLSDGLSSRDEQNDISGQGLGMSAVAQAVEDMGGELTVESAPGRGTCWSIRVPREARTDSMHPPCSASRS